MQKESVRKQKKKCPDTTLCDKELTKMPLCLFPVHHLLLGMDLTLGVVCIPSENASEKVYFSSASAYQF